MKKEEYAELCELSREILGHRYAWKKLRIKGLVSDLKRVGNGFTARRMPLSLEGVKHYLLTTKKMREELQKEMEAKKDE